MVAQHTRQRVKQVKPDRCFAAHKAVAQRGAAVAKVAPALKEAAAVRRRGGRPVSFCGLRVTLLQDKDAMVRAAARADDQAAVRDSGAGHVIPRRLSDRCTCTARPAAV